MAVYQTGRFRGLALLVSSYRNKGIQLASGNDINSHRTTPHLPGESEAVKALYQVLQAMIDRITNDHKKKDYRDHAERNFKNAAPQDALEQPSDRQHAGGLDDSLSTSNLGRSAGQSPERKNRLAVARSDCPSRRFL
ncbi:MAG: hypothetical protein ABWZ39_14980 [Pseudomonas caspiana]